MSAYEKVLLDSPLLVVSFFPAEGLLRLRWRGHHNAATAQQQCQRVLGFLPTAPCPRLINDSSEAYGEWEQASTWIGSEFAPLLATHGVRYVAWIQAMDWPARAAIASTLPHICGLELRTFDFDQQTAAHTWLLAQPA